MSINEVKQELSKELIFHVDNINTLKQLILNGADINYQNINGWCALFEAVCLGYNETVVFLISMQGDIQLKDKKGRNALFWALYHEDISMVKTLISLGVNPKEEVYPGLSSLEYASYKNNVFLIDILLKNSLKSVQR